MPIRIRTVASRGRVVPSMLLGGVLLLAAMAGCSNRHPPLLSEPVAASADATMIAAPMAVDVRNQLGTVRIIVDPRATETVVETLPVRTAPRAVRAADIATADGVRTLRVVVQVPEGEPEWTDVVIRTASVRGVTIRNTEGNIEVDGVEGSIDIQSGEPLRTTGGGIYVRMAAPLTTPITIATTRGDVRVMAPAASAGQVTLESSAGSVSLMGRKVESAGVVSAPRSWRGTINGGTQPVRISSSTDAVVLEFFE